eukprot:UN02035
MAKSEKPETPHFWPTFIRVWFWIQLCLLSFDASFVLTRPWSFKDGPLGMLYPAFQQYAAIDKVYADPSLSIGWAMSTCVLIENVLIGYALLFAYPADRRKSKHVTRKYMQKADFVLFASIFMQLSKTFFYFLNTVYDNFSHVSHNPASDLILMYVLPNLIWFVVPVFILTRYFVPKIKRTIALADNAVEKKD